MKQIPLTRGKVAIVDDADSAELSKYKWLAIPGTYTWYAARHLPTEPGGRRRLIRMHTQIMGTLDTPFQVDHADMNGLNNQRSNLRLATHAGNQRNRAAIGGSSAFKGVSWNRRDKRWQAHIGVEGKVRSLGYFTSEIAAAQAYNEAAALHHGEFARLNVVA